MTNKQKLVCGFILTSVFFTGSAFASSTDSLVNTPNADFNEIGNALVSSGLNKTVCPTGDVLVGNNGDPIASYSGSTGNWVYYNE